MLTFKLTGAGYGVYRDEVLVLDQPGDPRLECIESMVLAPFASAAEAEAHALASIAAMSPPVMLEPEPAPGDAP